MIKLDYDIKNNKARIITDDSVLTFIRNSFSIKDPNAGFMRAKLRQRGSNAKIPDRKYAIDKNGKFDFGLYVDIFNFLRQNSLSGLTLSDSFKKRLKIGFSEFELYDELAYPLRPYQSDVVEKCLTLGYGTVLVGTGGGKSLIQASLLENWKRLNGSLRALVIVPGVGLVNQLKKDFKEYSVSFTYSGWTGTEELQDTEVVIVNTECFCSQYHKMNLKKLDILLRDECHGNKEGNKITKLIKKIKTNNKFGFTGTLPKEDNHIWKIKGLFGPVIYEKSSAELRDENFLSDVKVKVLRLNHQKVVKGYKNELEFMKTDKSRLDFIKKITDSLNKNVLILVDYLEHGDNLVETLKSSNKEVFFVKGEMGVEERDLVKEKMESNDNIVTVAMSSIFSTGINIKNIHYILFVSKGKSFIRVVQSIGRGLRLHEDKKRVVIFDLYDNFKYSTEHSDYRKEFYDDESIKWSEEIINL